METLTDEERQIVRLRPGSHPNLNQGKKLPGCSQVGRLYAVRAIFRFFSANCERRDARLVVLSRRGLRAIDETVRVCRNCVLTLSRSHPPIYVLSLVRRRARITRR
jgi:hypothetical protein